MDTTDMIFIDDFTAMSWGLQHQGVWDTPWLAIPGAEFPARPGTTIRVTQVQGGYEARRLPTIRAQVEAGLAQMGIDGGLTSQSGGVAASDVSEKPVRATIPLGETVVVARPASAPLKIPKRIQNETTLRSARIRRVRGTSRYYVDFYNTDGRLSSLSPDSRRTFTGASAVEMALGWVS